MNRKLKALGLALFAVLALGALTAGSASAAGERFHSDGTPTTLTAAGNNVQTFTTTIGDLTCESVAGSQTISGTTLSEITFKPAYSNCHKEGGNPKVTVDMMSCGYTFTSEKVGEHAPVHIECTTPGDEITVKVVIGGVAANCIDVPAQTPTGGGVTYDNEVLTAGPPQIRDIKVTATVTGITYTETGVCGSGEANNGTYTGNVTITGENSLGEHTDIWWE